MVIAWTKECFGKVVQQWGEIMFWDDDDKEEGLASGRLCIKTPSMARVDNVLPVDINGKIFNVHIIELASWVPIFRKNDMDENSSHLNDFSSDTSLNEDDVNDAFDDMLHKPNVDVTVDKSLTISKEGC
ncbi:hypothetical protein L1987_21085 [Smallanthus sonchifolius]|uniref:Uncharacterized protein n=1 Tax=Smallanthus sonchifolius TaxID=185202 RepID=A0ACB9ITM9_9ASTR|nr:hypothetical protein L1987_21085 [Smallanthus sonchifolius]